MRNRFPLATLLEVNPHNYQAIVSDRSATTSITCFSDQANSLTRDVNEVLAELSDKNPYQLPQCLKQLEGTTHTFQFHFDTLSTLKRPDFVLDTVFQNVPLSLPAPPIPIQELPLIQGVDLLVTQPQNLQNLSPTLLEPPAINVANPPSPALSTTESNEPKVIEADIGNATTLKTTPPTEAPPETKKETKRKNLHQSTTRRALFETDATAEHSDSLKIAKPEDPKTNA
ncbi:hypothetical protein Tco_1441581 [Tanacetum coccineum]